MLSWLNRIQKTPAQILERVCFLKSLHYCLLLKKSVNLKLVLLINLKIMSKFNRGGGSDRRFGGRNTGRPMMHQATCGKCGRDCEVPFRPTGDRPVFCSDCFDKSGDRRRGDKKMFGAVCGKCGNKCEVPFQPNPDKPVYCNACFGKGDRGDRGGNKSSDQFKQQFEMLNAKLDKILKALTPAVFSKAVPAEKKSRKKIAKTKPTAKKAKK